MTRFSFIETFPAEEDTAEGVVWHDAEEDGDQDHLTAKAPPSAQESNADVKELHYECHQGSVMGEQAE